MRYVVLHHTGVLSPHFDLLYQTKPGAMLTSFRCPCWPPRVGDVLEERPDHRQAYLDYEGPISGDRGEVKRIAAGEVRLVDLTIDPPAFAIGLDDQREMVLTHGYMADDDRATLWTVTSVGDANRPEAPSVE